jgi:hypothetical protein
MEKIDKIQKLKERIKDDYSSNNADILSDVFHEYRSMVRSLVDSYSVSGLISELIDVGNEVDKAVYGSSFKIKNENYNKAVSHLRDDIDALIRTITPKKNEENEENENPE